MVDTAAYSDEQLPQRVASIEAHLQHLATKEDVQRILVELQSKMTWMIVMFLISLLGALASFGAAMLK